MTTLIASLVLAAVLPTDFLDSVGVAAYWYKKDSRGKGDEISEQAKPKRFPAFAITGDTFLVSDPAVRTKHLDKVEFWYGGKRYPAKEIARGENPDTVMIKTEKPIDGIKPIAFAQGEPVERLAWDWCGDSLKVESSTVGTNSDVKIDTVTRKAFHQWRKGDSLLLDKQRRPVALDFGDFELVKGERFTYSDSVAGCKLPPESFERAAQTIENRCAKATLPILIKLDQIDKTTRQRYSWSEDGSAATELDVLGVVIEGKVFVPTDMSGEDIARFKSAETTLADGSKAKLDFLGAVAEWRAIVFALPQSASKMVRSLSVSTAEPHSLLGERAWEVAVDNEGGSPIADAVRSRFIDVEFVRGAKFAAAYGRFRDYNSDCEKGNLIFAVNGSGEIVSMKLKRRHGEDSNWRRETIAPVDIIDALAGKAYNPEFRPRAEAERNRIVWLGFEAVELRDALAREKQAQSFIDRYWRPPLVTEVYPGSPCAKAGIKVGDILLAYRRGSEEERKLRYDGECYGRDWASYFESESLYTYYDFSATPWTDIESETNRELSRFGVGTKIALVYVRDGKRCETELVLEAAPPHYKNAAKSRNRALGTLVKDMTFEVRRFFKFNEKEPGVVIAKIKPGSPAAVAGLKVFELITEVNGEKVAGAKDFAAKIKDKKDLVFAVRRLSQTRMVKIHVQ